MNILTVFIISVVVLVGYLGKMSDLVRSWYPDGSYRYPMKEFGKIAGIVVAANIIVALMTKTKLTATIGIVLAVAYFAFIWAMVFSARYGKQIRAEAPLVIPMTVNIVFCRAQLAEGNFQAQWRTIKAYLWYLILPLIITLVIAVIRYCQLRGWIPNFRERTRERPRSNEEDEEDEEDEDDEADGYYDEDGYYHYYDDDEPDEGEGRPTGAEEWLRNNWLILVSLLAVITTLVTCLIVVFKTMS